MPKAASENGLGEDEEDEEEEEEEDEEDEKEDELRAFFFLLSLMKACAMSSASVSSPATRKSQPEVS
jgi:hypothetical protein